MREDFFRANFDDEAEKKHVREIIESHAKIGGIKKYRDSPFALNPNTDGTTRVYAKLGVITKLDRDLPPARGVVVGAGRCATGHLAALYTYLFPAYVWATHEAGPGFVKEAYNIYREKDWGNGAAFEMASQKLTSLKGRYEEFGEGIILPIHRWVDISTFNTPYLYGMLRTAPDLKVVVMIRNPKGFFKSCKKIRRDQRNFFIVEHDYGIYHIGGTEWDYGQFWYDCYKGIYDQLKMAHRTPDYVWEFDRYVRGEYVEEILDWWDIPKTQENIDKAHWYITEPGNRIHATPSEWNEEIEVPDLSYCDELWNFWKSHS